jgi:dipeptidyl aminopeptidase/acylaminoacyl peptidase
MAQVGDASAVAIHQDETRVPRTLAAVLLCLLALPASTGSAATDYGRLAYTTDRDGNYEIYSSRIDAPGETNLTSNPATDQSPAWSADGSQIAFVSDRDGRMDIWVMDWDGGAAHKVTSEEPGTSDFEPTWSPDATKLAFASSRGGSYHVWTVDLATGALGQLTPGWGTAPSWSPDGTRIAYDGGGSIRVIDATGGSDHQLTYCDCTGPEGSPVWSRDGSFVIFGRYDDDWQSTNIRQLYFVQANGGEGIPITSGPYFYGHPSFSPDGSLLVFQRQEGASWNPELYVMPLSGSAQYPQVTSPGHNFLPAWGATYSVPAPPPDTTPPTITIRRPTTSGTDRIDVYTVDQVVNADYTCTDAASGIRHCMGPVPSGDPIDTRFVGTYEFVVFAADQAGNPVYARTRYRVVYPFAGFFAPLAGGGMTQIRPGDSVPMKFSLGADYGLDVLTDATASPIDCATEAEIGPAEPAAGPFTYNASLDRYMKVWSTEKSMAGACYSVALSLRDGTRHEAHFRVDK